jgi:hypothetical protein
LDPHALGLSSLGRRVEGGFTAIRDSLDNFARKVGGGLKAFGPGLATAVVSSFAVDGIRRQQQIYDAATPPNAEEVEYMSVHGWKYEGWSDRPEERWRYDPTLSEGIQNTVRYFLINTDPGAMMEIDEMRRQVELRRGIREIY